MTRTLIENPYYERWFAMDGANRRYFDDPEGILTDGRRDLVRDYLWSIPNDDALAAIAALHLPIISVGAGTGYWESRLALAGADVIAFDIRPNGANEWHKGNAGLHFDVREGEAADSVLAHPRPVLFLSWPPYAMPMGANAVKAHHAAGGRYVAYVGEGPGGCTGDDMMHLLLGHGGDPEDCRRCEVDASDDLDWAELYDDATHTCNVTPLFEQTLRVAIPRWDGIYDDLTIYRRKDS